jgi:hypothetical protein
MEALLGVLVGVLVGVISTLLITKIMNNRTVPTKLSPYIRRGIWKKSYKSSSTGDVEVQFELGEIESTSTKSKVVVILSTTDKSEFNTSDVLMSKINSMVNNTWMLSNDIEWISDISKVRGEKIDEILKK